MRPLYLKLIAAGLITVCALWIIRQTVWQNSGSNISTGSPSVARASRIHDRIKSSDTRPRPATLSTHAAPSVQPSTHAATHAATNATTSAATNAADFIRVGVE